MFNFTIFIHFPQLLFWIFVTTGVLHRAYGKPRYPSWRSTNSSYFASSAFSPHVGTLVIICYLRPLLLPCSEQAGLVKHSSVPSQEEVTKHDHAFLEFCLFPSVVPFSLTVGRFGMTVLGSFLPKPRLIHPGLPLPRFCAIMVAPRQKQVWDGREGLPSHIPSHEASDQGDTEPGSPQRDGPAPPATDAKWVCGPG